MSHNVIKTK